MPDAFTEQTVQERATFLEPSYLRVFFCSFPVFNSQCFSKNLSENAQASLFAPLRWIMAILIQASLVRGLIS